MPTYLKDSELQVIQCEPFLSIVQVQMNFERSEGWMQMEMDEADQKPQKHIQKQVVTNFTNAVATRLQGPSTFTSGEPVVQ